MDVRTDKYICYFILTRIYTKWFNEKVYATVPYTYYTHNHAKYKYYAKRKNTYVKANNALWSHTTCIRGGGITCLRHKLQCLQCSQIIGIPRDVMSFENKENTNMLVKLF